MLLLLALVMNLSAPDPAAVVLKPVANMYSKADPNADVVSQAIHGAVVQIIDQSKNWARIRSEDDYTGWVPLNALRKLPEGAKSYASEGRTAQVESLFANVYRVPDLTKNEPLLTLPFEARLEVTAEPEPDGRWLEVRLADGRKGWIQRGDVIFKSRRLSSKELVSFSKRFLGLPYLWGGTSTFGYDCSGFTQMLFRRRGVLIPRDSGPQALWEGFIPVARGELAPGDLLFFGDSLQKITHTGMYIGEGEFINATTHQQPRVRIDRLDDPHWTKLFVAARRLK